MSSLGLDLSCYAFTNKSDHDLISSPLYMRRGQTSARLAADVSFLQRKVERRRPGIWIGTFGPILD